MARRNDDREDGIEALLDELKALRDLDRLRQAFPPDSDAHAVAAEQVERRSRRLMQRFRELRDDLPKRRSRRATDRDRRRRRPRTPLARVPLLLPPDRSHLN